MDWQQVARTIAPTVATGLLGPLGGIAANVASQFLFPDPADRVQVTPQKVMDRIATMTDPADLQKLREAEVALKKYEGDNNFRFAQLAEESQQNARVMRQTGFASGNQTADRLAWLTVISFLVVASLVLGIIFAAVKGWLGPVGSDPTAWAAVSGLLGSLVGYFSANANQVISFYFGSSAGSAAKTDQLAEHAREAFNAVRRLTPPPGGPGRPGGGGGGGGSGGPALNVQSKPDGTVSATAAISEPESGQIVREGVRPSRELEPAGAMTDASVADVTVRFGEANATTGARADEARTSPLADAQELTPAEYWDECIDFVLQEEGGFANNPVDRGGPTNFGITQSTLSGVRGRPVTVQDVRDLTRADAIRIYRQNYWQATSCGQLPPGVDLCVFDSAVLCGPDRAGRFLQTAAGLTGAAIDGVIGPKTLDAVRKDRPVELIEAIVAERERFQRGLVSGDPSQEVFADGWTRRVERLRKAALAMAEGALVQA